MKDDAILAVDIGTSSVRVMVFDISGDVLAKSRLSYGVLMPKQGFEEQDPTMLFQKVMEAIERCLTDVTEENRSRIRGICFSSQMYGIFAVDQSGKVLSNNILWSDSRAAVEEIELKEKLGAECLTKTTGCPVSAMYPLAKLLWMKNHQPEIFTSAYKFISIKDLIVHTLTGRWVADCSMASATGFLDIARHCWAEKALAMISLSPDKLPELVMGDRQLPFTDAVLCRKWGLPADVVVIPGGGDGPLANIGSGAWEVGDINIDLGTSGAIRVMMDHASEREKTGLWCYCLSQDRWLYGGILTNVGNAFAWLVEKVMAPCAAKDVDLYALGNELASRSKAGASNLFFLPYLRAARSPYWTNALKGMLYGLDPAHELGDIIRAMFESIAYDLAAILSSIRNEVQLKGKVFLTGGLSKSELLAQILADVLEMEIQVPQNSEGSISGAALFGFKALGVLDFWSFGRTAECQIFRPEQEKSEIYRLAKQRYNAIVKCDLSLGEDMWK